MNESLRFLLFPDDGESTYAIVDGASCPELLEKLDEWQPDYVCLYAGELTPDMQEVAPYLIALSPQHPFTTWFLANFYGKHWGIVARSPAGLRAMRKHFRAFLLVKSPGDKTWYFRYYDPRVLSIYLTTANAAEQRIIFGPVSTYFSEAEQGDYLSFRHEDGILRQDVLSGAEMTVTQP